MFENDELERLMREVAAGFEPLGADAPALATSIRSAQVAIKSAMSAAERGDWRTAARDLTVTELHYLALLPLVSGNDMLVETVADTVVQLRELAAKAVAA